MIECDGDCGSAWEPNGDVRDLPKWALYPDVYPRPAAPSAQPDELKREAHLAVSRRLGHPIPSAVLGAAREGTDALVRLNSGGNACAVREHLAALGHEVSVEGCAVRVHGVPAQIERPAGCLQGLGCTADGYHDRMCRYAGQRTPAQPVRDTEEGRR